MNLMKQNHIQIICTWMNITIWPKKCAVLPTALYESKKKIITWKIKDRSLRVKHVFVEEAY